MSQIVIDIGATANDGTGDPLRTAFNDVNLNFANVFAAGPVDSNIQITNNTILTINTNGNLVLAPNGIGKVVSNVDLVPNQSNVHNLGSTSKRWNTVFSKYADFSGNVTVNGTLTTANLVYSYSSNVFVGDLQGSVLANDSTVIVDSPNSAINVDTLTTGSILSGDIIPTANVSYSLGNVDYQWKDIWVGNSTIYLGNIPLSVNSDNTLTFGGDPVITQNASQVSIGNFEFNGNSIQNLNGGAFDNGDLSHGATSGLNLAPNGSGDSLLFNNYGNLSIVTGLDNGNTKTFVFGKDGNLTVPLFLNAAAVESQGYVQGYNFYVNGELYAYGQAHTRDVTPQSNTSYSLGTSSNQWANTWTNNVYVSSLNSGQLAIAYNNGQLVGGPDLRWDFANAKLWTTGLDSNGVIHTSSSISATGNIVTNGYFVGTLIGDQIGNFVVPGNNTQVLFNTSGNADASAGFTFNKNSNVLTISGNVSADYFIGDGSQLTGLPASYSDANVATFLTDLGSNAISTTATVTAGNLSISNITIGATSNAIPVVIQPIQELKPWWYSLYGDLSAQAKEDYPNGTAQDSTGNIYVSGKNDSGGLPAFLVKYDSFGNIIWQKQFDIDNHIKRDVTVAVDNDDNVCVVVVDGGSSYFQPNYMYLLKLDPLGSLLWQKQITVPEAYIYVGNTTFDANNNIYIVANTNRRYCFKFDSLGNLVWQKATTAANGYGIAVDATGNVIVGDNPVAKLDSSGNVLFQVYHNVNYEDNTIVDNTGNIYVCGASGQVQKIDSSGNSIWLAQSDLLYRSVFGMSYDASTNSLFITGDFDTQSSQSYDLFLASLDADNGDINWINGFGSTNDEFEFNYQALNTLSVKNGLAIVTGYTYYNNLNYSNLVTFSVPTNGSGLGTYGDFRYYSLTETVTSTITPGTTSPATLPVTTDGDATTSTGNVTITNNTYTSDLVQFVSGGPLDFTFTSDGYLIFPDGTTQVTGFADGGNYNFGNTNINDLTLQSANVHIGRLSGYSSQGNNSVAIGNTAGQVSQGESAIAIGSGAGKASQGANSIALGLDAGNNNSSTDSIAIGRAAGQTQSSNAIAIGTTAGTVAQGDTAIAIGTNAGQYTQYGGSIAIGVNAGLVYQYYNSVAIGPNAGVNNQNWDSVAIGNSAAYAGQGPFSIAIGSQASLNSFQAGNSIIINASSVPLENTTENTTVIKPIRESANVSGISGLYYNSTSGEVVHYANSLQLAVYANATVRDSVITSPEPGMMIYLTDTGMQVRGASQWNTIAGTNT